MYKKLHVFQAVAIAAVMTTATLSAATTHASNTAATVKQPFHATELNRVPNHVRTDSSEINRREWPLPALIRPATEVASEAVAKPVRVAAPRASRSRSFAAPTGSAQQIGFRMMLQIWPSSEWPALNQLWEKESGWNPNSVNPSGACGIPQALPCSKIRDHSVAGQIAWGLGYIKDRYGSPSAAWAHSQSHNWY